MAIHSPDAMTNGRVTSSKRTRQLWTRFPLPKRCNVNKQTRMNECSLIVYHVQTSILR